MKPENPKTCLPISQLGLIRGADIHDDAIAA
jgi:hypothetical protein